MNQKELFLISLTIFFTIICWILIEAFKVDTETKLEKEETVHVVKKVNIDTSIFTILKEKQ